MKIIADATLANLSELLPPPFKLSLFSNMAELIHALPSHEILFCRSTLKVTPLLLAGSNIRSVATASSGVDHIDVEYLKENGIQLFDAKGCNARSVADYVVATLAFLSKNNQIMGYKAGIVGLGEVGSRVEKRLKAAGFNVLCYDPLKAISNDHYPYCALEELTTCDLLCIHANLHDTPPYPSLNLIDTKFLSKLKPGTIIINAARGGIIDEKALLATQKQLTYCTDVYLNEPNIEPAIVNFSTLCTPHIAGHSIEAKSSAIIKICQQLHEHYGLKFKDSMLNSPSSASSGLSSDREHWEDAILDLYSPFIDTQILKQAPDKAQSFLVQRKAHQFRHDFSFYDHGYKQLLVRKLLGL